MILQECTASRIYLLAYATLFVSQIGFAAEPTGNAPPAAALIEKGGEHAPVPAQTDSDLNSHVVTVETRDRADVPFVREVAVKTHKTLLSEQQPDPEFSPQVTRFMSTQVNETMVIVNAGVAQGIVLGTIYDTLRLSAAPVAAAAKSQYTWIKTGEVKILEPHETFSLARITMQNTDLSKTFFGRFPGVMSGDKLVRRKVTVVKTKAISPTRMLAYHDLFVDPKASPRSFELTREGKEHLAAMAAYYADLRAPLLMIESYTDDEGTADANQIESYQRALTIRQYLVEELGFEPSRVVAIGFGEADQTDDEHTPGFHERNRRIVFKVNGLAKMM